MPKLRPLFYPGPYSDTWSTIKHTSLLKFCSSESRPVKSHSLRVRLPHFHEVLLINLNTWYIIYMESHAFFTFKQHTYLYCSYGYTCKISLIWALQPWQLCDSEAVIALLLMKPLNVQCMCDMGPPMSLAIECVVSPFMWLRDQLYYFSAIGRRGPQYWRHPPLG